MSFRAARALLAGVSLVVSGIGCLAAPMGSRGYPLYPESVGHLPISRVASLVLSPSAIVKTVDGREVSGVGREGVFELLPGCHIVEIQRRQVFRGRSGLVLAPGTLDPYVFVFEMKPGYEYTIVADTFSGTTALIHATEQDPSGARTRTIDPIHPAVAPQACRGNGLALIRGA